MPLYLCSTSRSRSKPTHETFRAAELAPRRVQGRRTYDVRIASLPSPAEAEAIAQSLDGKYGVSSPRVTR